MGLKPGQKRRLAAEQAIYNKFPSMAACNDACIKYCEKRCLDATFNKVTVQQYVGCQTNLSVKRLKILAEVLGVTNFLELDEIFIAPKHRGEGDYWVGDQGNRVPDIKLPSLL